MKSELVEIQEKISDIEDEIKEEKESLEEDVDKYIKLLKESKICPLCFNDITTSQIKKIVKEIEC